MLPHIFFLFAYLITVVWAILEVREAVQATGSSLSPLAALWPLEV